MHCGFYGHKSENFKAGSGDLAFLLEGSVAIVQIGRAHV